MGPGAYRKTRYIYMFNFFLLWERFELDQNDAQSMDSAMSKKQKKRADMASLWKKK